MFSNEAVTTNIIKDFITKMENITRQNDSVASIIISNRINCKETILLLIIEKTNYTLKEHPNYILKIESYGDYPRNGLSNKIINQLLEHANNYQWKF